MSNLKKQKKRFMTNSTADLLDIAAEPTHFQWEAAIEELKFRLIKQGDSDDSAQHRGGIRPLHAPIV